MATLLLRKYSIHPRTPGTLKQDMMTDMRFYFPFIRSRPSQAMGLAFGASRLQDFCMSVCHLSRGDPCIVYRRCRCETNVLYIALTGSWLTLVAHTRGYRVVLNRTSGLALWWCVDDRGQRWHRAPFKVRSCTMRFDDE